MGDDTFVSHFTFKTSKEMLHELQKEKGYTIGRKRISIKSRKDYVIGKTIVCINKMDSGGRGWYSYRLTAKYGDVYQKGIFEPYLTPAEMLRYGVFEGKYLNDCIFEFPKEWFITAIKHKKISPAAPNKNCNYFKTKSRLSLSEWSRKRWLIGADNRGWFQWYCRYYIGRREPKIDAIQMKRWRAYKRHFMQVKKNCKRYDLSCRPRQRQSLLQWSYNCFI
jgi:hypothetical protein